MVIREKNYLTKWAVEDTRRCIGNLNLILIRYRLNAQSALRRDTFARMHSDKFMSIEFEIVFSEEDTIKYERSR